MRGLSQTSKLDHDNNAKEKENPSPLGRQTLRTGVHVNFMENCIRISGECGSTSTSEQFRWLLRHIENPNYIVLRKSSLSRSDEMRAPAAAALTKSRWLRFNTKAIKFIIVDVDGTSLRQFVEKHVLALLRLPPSWLIETDNGVQLAYALRDQIPLHGMSPQTKRLLVATKEALIACFGADRRATMRSTGFWRNPLTHEGHVSADEYTLVKIAKAYGVKRHQPPKTQPIATARPVTGWTRGNRNVALYWRCVMEINAFPDRYSEQELGDWAVAVNASQESPLPEREAHKTGRSAWRQYHVYGKRLSYQPAFDHKAWKRAYNAEYYRTKQKRGDEMTRQEAVAIARKALMDDRKSRVERGLMILQMEGRKVTVRALAEAAGVAKDTAAKYLRQLRAEGAI